MANSPCYRINPLLTRDKRSSTRDAALAESGVTGLAASSVELQTVQLGFRVSAHELSDHTHMREDDGFVPRFSAPIQLRMLYIDRQGLCPRFTLLDVVPGLTSTRTSTNQA